MAGRGDPRDREWPGAVAIRTRRGGRGNIEWWREGDDTGTAVRGSDGAQGTMPHGAL